MTVRKRYPAGSNHATKVHTTVKDVIDDQDIMCPNCRGTGTVYVTGVRPHENTPTPMPCPVCGGEGTLA